MDRKTFYFDQPVTESELNGAFDTVEQAIWNIMRDQNLIGIAQNMTGAQASPTPNQTVLVSGPGYAYDPMGERIFTASPNETVDLSKDSNGVVTTVSGAGNEKYISVFVHFTRALSDPRVDGNSNTVFFIENESHEYIIVQGAEAAVGTATRPALDSTSLLLFDVHRIFGQTQFLNADIDMTTRRQDTFVMNQSPLSIRTGTVPLAIQAMLTNLNNHINGVAGAHPATSITTAAHGSGPITVPATTVQASLNAIVDYLNAGVSVVAEVASIATLQTIVSGSRIGGSAIVVMGATSSSLPMSYIWDPTIIATSDSLLCIRPTDIANDSLPGRWVSPLRQLAVTQLDLVAKPAAKNLNNGLIGVFREQGFVSIAGSSATLSVNTGPAITAAIGDLMVVLTAAYCSPAASQNITPQAGYKDGTAADNFVGIGSAILGASSGIPTGCFTDFFNYTVVIGGTQLVRMGFVVSNPPANVNVEALVLQFRP